MFYIILFIILLTINYVLQLFIMVYTNSISFTVACILALDSSIVVYCIQQYIKDTNKEVEDKKRE